MSQQEELQWLQELREKAEPRWLDLLKNPGGAAILADDLPTSLPARKVAEDGTDERRVWELIGLHYRAQRRWYDAIAIYSSMYDHFLGLQLSTVTRVDKGMPLVWIADCYSALGFGTLSKRYLMLTLVEDAIRWKGDVDPKEMGSYYRLVWRHGLSDQDFMRYATKAAELAVSHTDESMFPEWVLQELDQNWLVEVPNPNEAAYYDANRIYVQYLLDHLGEPTGKGLERLADYLLSCMPGCRTARRARTKSTDYDIVCSLQGPDIDFRSELGRYFVCECKDWKKTAVNFGSFAKFCRVLDSVKARFGIIFSRHGISGEDNTADAEREQLKVFQDRGMVIIVVSQGDLDYVAAGGNFIALLREKYEKVRLDLRLPSRSHQ